MVSKFFVIYLILLILFLIFISIIMLTQEEVGKKEVKCYDRNNHEIKGETCYVVIYCNFIYDWLDSCPIKENGR